MENFSLQWRNSTKKDLRVLPNQEVARIVAAVTALVVEPLPHGSQKLAGSERTYRIRVGGLSYRLRGLHGFARGRDSARPAPQGCLPMSRETLSQSA